MADKKPLVVDLTSGKTRQIATGETVPLANGGTGATTQSAAANAVLPTQSGHSGEFLTTNGSAVSWGAAGGGGTVTTTGSPSSSNLAFFSGSTSITSGDLSGDVSTSGTGATTIGALKVATSMVQASAITLAKIQNAAASSKLLGSGASGSGSAYVEITLGTNLSMSGTTLNATGGGGSGTVTSVDGSGGATGLTLTGGPITGSGTLTLGGTLVVANGGTGVATLAAHGVLVGNGASAVAVTAAGTAGYVLTANGASADPTFQAAIYAAPQGRLTLVSGSPVMTSDQTAKGTVYYTPYIGNSVPIYDGTNTVPKAFAELTLTLNATDNLLNNCYDIFVFNNSGTLTLGTGPAWTNTATVTITIATPAVITWTAHGLSEGSPVVFTNSGGALPTGITAGTTYFVSVSPAANTFNISTTVANAAAGTKVATSGSQSGTHTGTNGTTVRGTGAGTTEIEQKNGVWANKNSITLRAGGSSLATAAADQATYLGTIYCTANGQTGMAFRPTGATGGSAPILGLFNAYNRVRSASLELDTTTVWTYAVATWRAANGNVNNRITWVQGLAQSFVDARLDQTVTATTTSAAVFGIAQDSTNVAPVTNLQMGNAAQAGIWSASAGESFVPALGVHFAQAMEISLAGTSSFNGAPAAGRQVYALRVALDL